MWGLGKRGCALAVAIFSTAGTGFAADLPPIVLGPVKSPTVPLNWTISLEAGPEFHATTRGSTEAGSYADTSIKGSLGYAFDSNWLLNGTVQVDLKSNATQQYYVEAGLGYKFAFGNFSLTPQAALGDTWDATGLGEDGDANALYYALYLSADVKLDSHWSWTIVSARWRDAFDYQWQTPKLSTGLSYAVSDAAKLAIDAGYSWKNTGDGYYGDKVNLSAAFKYAF